jgi:hypothetical protein
MSQEIERAAARLRSHDEPRSSRRTGSATTRTSWPRRTCRPTTGFTRTRGQGTDGGGRTDAACAATGPLGRLGGGRQPILGEDVLLQRGTAPAPPGCKRCGDARRCLREPPPHCPSRTRAPGRRRVTRGLRASPLLRRERRGDVGRRVVGPSLSQCRRGLRAAPLLRRATDPCPRRDRTPPQ